MVPVKGQAKVVVFVGVMALTAVLAAIPATLTMNLLDINLDSSDKAQKIYESGVYTYMFVAHRENNVYSQEELNSLHVSDSCKFENLPDDREVLFVGGYHEGIFGECTRRDTYSSSLFFWHTGGYLDSVVAAEVKE